MNENGEAPENFIDRIYDLIENVVEAIDRVGRRLRDHRLFPNRKVVYGFVSGVVTTAILKLGLNADDPTVAYLSPLVVGYITSWLVTDGPVVESHTIEDEAVLEAERRAAEDEAQTEPPPAEV